jgi:4-hydroxy-L-threonine phosphate dehydrogenase PdxA
MSIRQRVIAITAGDVAGIGPEVIIRAIAHSSFGGKDRVVLIGHPEIFRRAAEMFGFELRFFELQPKCETAAPTPLSD